MADPTAVGLEGAWLVVPRNRGGHGGSCFETIGLRVTRVLPCADLFKHAVGNEFAEQLCACFEANTGHKCRVPRSQKEFGLLRFVTMFANRKDNPFAGQGSMRKGGVPGPPNPFFSGGFEPRLALRAPDTDPQFAPVFLSRAPQRHSPSDVFGKRQTLRQCAGRSTAP